MTTLKLILKDPYAWAAAEKLRKQLSPLIRAIRWLEKWKPELFEKMRRTIEPRLVADAKKWETAYFDCLAELCVLHGANADPIQLQLRYPKLRKLYVKRRVTAEISHLFRWL